MSHSASGSFPAQKAGKAEDQEGEGGSRFGYGKAGRWIHFNIAEQDIGIRTRGVIPEKGKISAWMDRVIEGFQIVINDKLFPEICIVPV